MQYYDFPLCHVTDHIHPPQGWGKGAVFVNGQNLGRHWFVGPQHFLYVPGAWLRGGENQVRPLDPNTMKHDGRVPLR